jgi:hypothetical protein
MDDKYNISNSKKPETKQELIQQQIEELVKRRDAVANPAVKKEIQKEIMTLFAQYERLKLWVGRVLVLLTSF